MVNNMVIKYIVFSTPQLRSSPKFQEKQRKKEYYQRFSGPCDPFLVSSLAWGKKRKKIIMIAVRGGGRRKKKRKGKRRKDKRRKKNENKEYKDYKGKRQEDNKKQRRKSREGMAIEKNRSP